MGKNKIIGLVIWLITLVGPMKSWMFYDYDGFMFLLMFLLTLTGVYGGSYFFSKSSAKKVA